MTLWVLGGLALAAFGVWWWQASAAAQRQSERRDVWRRWQASVTVAASNAEPAPVPAGDEAPADSTRAATPSRVPPVSLLNTRPVTPEAAACLVDLSDSLPRPRAVLTQLLLAGDDPVELARVVATDTASAALLLRTVNSARFHLTRPVSSVQHAVTYLGANLVRDMAIRHALALPAPAHDPAAERANQRLWRIGYLASTIALAVARHQRWPSAGALSTQALLFGLGDIALLAHHPGLAELYAPDYGLPARVEEIQRRLALNPAMAAAHLGRVWQLPQELVRGLGASLTPLAGGPQQLAPDLLAPVTLGYFSTGLADVMLRQGSCDPRTAVDTLLGLPHAFFLPEYLAACGVSGVLDALAQPAAARRLNAVWASTHATGERDRPEPSPD
ncbi:MAG TPA: hypothetical protein DIT63_12025 [Gammaproteobacteria bacterium]|nr:hypothetical protein [Gammaproteobacteria bacterium]